MSQSFRFIKALENIYYEFATFGSRTQQQMDNKAFAKFARDCGLLDNNLTATDVDIIFMNNKVKPKSERKITFDQFLVALQLCADKKGVSIYTVIEQVLRFGAPLANVSATPETEQTVFEKLTDHRQYTGYYKQRFTEDGKGVAAREQFNTVHAPSFGPPPPRPSSSTGSSSSNGGGGFTSPRGPITPRTPTKLSASSPARVGPNGTTVPEIPSGSIFDRLTDPSTYSGVYRIEHRQQGINAHSPGDVVHDLSQITRTNLGPKFGRFK